MTLLVLFFLQLVWVVFVARVIFSWVRPSPQSAVYPIAEFIDRITEPIVAPLRRALPSTGGFDFSVTIVLLVLTFVLIPLASQL